MATTYKFFTFILFMSLFIQNFAQIRNIFKVSDEQIGKVTHFRNTNFNFEEINAIGFQNANDCDCGENALNCKRGAFNRKQCDCVPNYAQKGDKCEHCDCGEGASKCWFDIFNKKQCECAPNYAPKGDKCEQCYCGDTAISCEFLGSEKACNCKIPYVEKNGKCATCHCGLYTDFCDLKNNKKICTCFENFFQNEQDECVYKATPTWVYVVSAFGAIFVVSIVVILIFFFIRKMQR